MVHCWAAVGMAAGLTAATCAGLAAGDPLPRLEAKHFTSGRVQLHQIIPVNHDTRLFRFRLPGGKDYMAPVSSCIACELMHQGVLYRRYYTPVNPIGSKGYIDLMVKLYPNGKMTPLLWSLKPGDKISFSYWQKEQWRAHRYDTIGMLAGGVGITPMLQIIREVVTNPYDRTKIKLLFVNKTEDDIVLREELDRLVLEYPETLEVHYLLTRPSKSWMGPSGAVCPKVIAKFMPPPGPRTKLFVCGPHGFYHTLCGVGRSTINHWTQTNTRIQPGINMLGHAAGSCFSTPAPPLRWQSSEDGVGRAPVC
eukprot:EG_transcript_14001